MITQDQLVGARFEKCVVEKLIGRGGYGLTFLAFDEELQEHRVVKVSQDAGLDEGMRRRHLKSFLEEGLILSRLKHPQIVTLRGQGDKHGHRYMILDYIQGFSLRNVLDLVQQRQAELGCAWRDLMDPVTATALVLSALYPLEYAHRANVHLPDREIFGVAHRDISPGNLILGIKGNEKGRLILIDFGTAKTDLKENITVDQNLVGTVPYMGRARLQKANSPEQMALYQDFWKDFRETQHDIHALGVLYYQLLTGRLPFPGETSPQIIIKILDPESYSQCHLEIAAAHPYASGVLRKCLVYHDFKQPLSEQPFQYTDAAGMLPDMVSVFDTLSSGSSVNEILVNLAKKLARPENWVPSHGRDFFESLPSTDIQNQLQAPLPTRYIKLTNTPSPKSRIGIYLIAVLCTIGLAFAAHLWLRSPNENASPSHLKAQGQVQDQVPKVLKDTQAGLPSPAPGLEDLDTEGEPLTEPSDIEAPKPAPGISVVPSHPPSQVQPTPASKPSPTEKKRIPANSKLKSDRAFDKEAFVEIQTLVREEDPGALDRILEALNKNPQIPDLLLLKCQVIIPHRPTSMEARAGLADLVGVHPRFTHPELFKEAVMYSLFQVDAAIFEAQKTPKNRVNLLKSGNGYLVEFGPNSSYEEKTRAVKKRMGQ